jgi:putative oxidoreductase
MSFRRLLDTPDDHTLTLLRAILGVVFFAHGAQKVLGWFGGNGFEATLGFMTHTMRIPAVFAVLAVLAEFLGGIGLILGLLSRIAAFAIAIEMAVAMAMVHLPNGFFMNWTGNQRGEGFEYHLLAIATAIMIVVRGAGAWSIDRLWERARAGGRQWQMAAHRPHPLHG